MNLFIYYPKCSTCQKAKKWLEKNNIEFIENVSFKKFCTYGVGGKIKLMVLPFDINELTKFLEFFTNTFYAAQFTDACIFYFINCFKFCYKCFFNYCPYARYFI